MMDDVLTADVVRHFFKENLGSDVLSNAANILKSIMGDYRKLHGVMRHRENMGRAKEKAKKKLETVMRCINSKPGKRKTIQNQMRKLWARTIRFKRSQRKGATQ